MPLTLLSILIFLPPAGFYLLGTDSHSAGLAIASFVIIGILGVQMWPRIPWGLFALIGGALIIHVVIAAMLRPIDGQRAALSLGLLALVAVVATFLARWFFDLRDTTIGMVLETLRYMMIALALASLTGFQPTAANFVDKPVFPFTEPSHFALIFVPLVAQACFTSRGLRRYTWLGITMALALLLQNLSLIVATILIAGICMPLWLMVVAALISTSIVGLLDTSYFIDRLDFSAQTTNQSSLVYLQGWELATDAVTRTSGWGIGFQQLGLGVFNSPSADVLFRLYRLEANLYDGGFVAAKLSSELGIFGILIIIAYIIAAIRISLFLRKVSLGYQTADYSIITASSIFACYSIDIFVRGLGYFSASSTIFIAAVIFLVERRMKNRQLLLSIRAR